MPLLQGEVPADFLARVVEGVEATNSRGESHHLSHRQHSLMSEGEMGYGANARRDEGVGGGVSDGVRTRDLQGHNLAL